MQRTEADWQRLAALAEFDALRRARRRFIVPATLFFLIYYFSLPILVGYAPGVMRTPLWGAANLAYLFALSQFFMAWGLAWLYLRAARRWDVLAARLAAQSADPAGGP